jgi:hypothetical protein
MTIMLAVRFMPNLQNIRVNGASTEEDEVSAV